MQITILFVDSLNFCALNNYDVTVMMIHFISSVISLPAETPNTQIKKMEDGGTYCA